MPAVSLAPPRRFLFASRRQALWQRLWRRPAFRRGFYELLGLILARRSGFQMLNCGHHEPGYPHFTLAPEEEGERLGYQLYHRVAGQMDLAGRDVVEFGCGRGGGARFLAHAMAPRRYVATDASRLLIHAARRAGGPTPLRFNIARAEQVNFAPESFDVGIAVEALSPLEDKAAFLTAAARVLRAGGWLIVADFFYTRESSRNSASVFRALVAQSLFELKREEDWTAQAAQALELDSPRRLAAIDGLPRLYRRAALSFAGTTHSPLYQQLCDGRAKHMLFVLQKRPVPDASDHRFRNTTTRSSCESSRPLGSSILCAKS